jgi:hypothetical protein
VTNNLLDITVAETAIASSVVAVFAVTQSIWATLRTGHWARENRVWEQRKEVYVDLLKWAIRQRELSKLPKLYEWLRVHGHELPGAEEVIALEARASAFSSKKVTDKVNARGVLWDQLVLATKDLESLEAPDTDKQALREMFSQSIGQPEDRLARLADQITKWADELIDMVSSELQSSKRFRR